jgi:nucleoside-diphosphate-sugar epimerase
MRVMVLGGTGGAGRALIRELQGGAGCEVVVVSRRVSELPGVHRVIQGSYGALAATEAFRRELAQTEMLIHLGDGLPALERKENMGNAVLADRLVEASSVLARAAREANVPLLIHVSSIKAIADEEDDRVLVETAAPRGTTLYGRSKLRVEQAIARACNRSATRYILLRPPVLYGEGMQGSLDRLMRLADTPWPLPLGAISNRRSLMALSNLASLLAHLVRHGADVPSGPLHVQDGAPLSTTEIVTALREGLGRAPRLVPFASIGHLACRLPVAGPVARRLYGSLEVSDAVLRQSVRWTPPMSSQAALRWMARSHLAR